jgi:hypothetical protein
MPGSSPTKRNSNSTAEQSVGCVLGLPALGCPFPVITGVLTAQKPFLANQSQICGSKNCANASQLPFSFDRLKNVLFWLVSGPFQLPAE